jgi:DNA-binding XRE family transcriptional regulator
MITGAQIRKGRAALGWTCCQLADKAKVTTRTITRGESTDGEPPITLAHAAAIKHALEAKGIDFTAGKASKTSKRLMAKFSDPA